MKRTIVVLGGDDAIGEHLATRVAGEAVVFLDEDDRAVERVAEAGVDARVADPTDPATLDREEVREPGTAIVASREDSRNLLAAQQLRRAERVIALVNDPTNVAAFVEAGIEPVCAASTLAAALDARRRREPSLEETTDETPDSTEDTETTDESTGNERLRSDGGTDENAAVDGTDRDDGDDADGRRGQ